MVLCTANVLTLHPAHDDVEVTEGSARRLQIADWAAQQDVAVMGLQEARSRTAFARTAGQYYMVGTAADHRGRFGVELWFNLQAPGFRIDDVWRVHEAPRLLIVRASLHGRPWLWVAGHAPSDPQGWWEDLASLLAQHARPGEDVIALLDANAHIGSVPSEFVGQVDEEEEVGPGEAMHDFLKAVKLAAPSTFLGGGPTWRHMRSGHWHRCDYVLVPRAMRDSCLHAWVDRTAAIALGLQEDHRAAMLELVVVPADGPAGGAVAQRTKRPRGFYSREALKDEVVRETLDEAWRQTPPLPKSWPTDKMEEAFIARSWQLLEEVAPCPTARPLKQWMSSSAWQAVRAHAAARKAFFGHGERNSWIRLRGWFSAWKVALLQAKVALPGLRSSQRRLLDPEFGAAARPDQTIQIDPCSQKQNAQTSLWVREHRAEEGVCLAKAKPTNKAKHAIWPLRNTLCCR